jgi:hypothetical protein
MQRSPCELSLSAATINLRLSAVRRLTDEAAESGWLNPELAIGILRVFSLVMRRCKQPNGISDAGGTSDKQ